MPFAKQATRAIIPVGVTFPAPIGGAYLSGTVEIRGASFYNGDLYLYTHDSGTSTFWKIALNGQPNGYTVLAGDITSWSHPFSSVTTLDNPISNSRRTFGGLQIFSDQVWIVTPSADLEEWALVSHAPFAGGLEIPDHIIYGDSTQTLRVPYAGFKNILATGTSTNFYISAGTTTVDEIAGPFDFYVGKQVRFSPSLAYVLPGSVSISSFEPAMLTNHFDENVFILLTEDSAVDSEAYLWFDDPDASVTPPLGDPITFDSDYGTSTDKIWTFEYSDENHRRYFYTVYFDGSDNIVIDLWEDRATGVSISANVSTSQSSNDSPFDGGTVSFNIDDATDEWGGDVNGTPVTVFPEDTPVLVWVATVGPPDLGGISPYSNGPFFDELEDPLTDHLWFLTEDPFTPITFYYRAPRSVGTPYTEQLKAVIGFTTFAGFTYPD